MQNLRKHFPIFSLKREQPLIYFDNASTSQKPQSVIDAVTSLPPFFMLYEAIICSLDYAPVPYYDP